MGNLTVNADAIAAYGTLIFLVLDVVALILIGVFTQRIYVTSQNGMRCETEDQPPRFPLTRLHVKHRDSNFPASGRGQ